MRPNATKGFETVSNIEKNGKIEITVQIIKFNTVKIIAIDFCLEIKYADFVVLARTPRDL